MFSNKPYLIRAFYEWIIDNHCTPYIVINANYPRVKVPLEHIENGEITLNVSPSAVRDFNVSNDLVEFRASFSGVIHIITAPVKSVLAIYAHENQQGMFFDYEEPEEEGESEGEGERGVGGLDSPLVAKGEGPLSPVSRAHLKLVE